MLHEAPSCLLGDRNRARLAVNFTGDSHRFQCLENGTAWLILSCQFGTMFTEPAAPHLLQTRRRPIID